jgi:hypothetical protein
MVCKRWRVTQEAGEVANFLMQKINIEGTEGRTVRKKLMTAGSSEFESRTRNPEQGMQKWCT